MPFIKHTTTFSKPRITRNVPKVNMMNVLTKSGRNIRWLRSQLRNCSDKSNTVEFPTCENEFSQLLNANSEEILKKDFERTSKII